MADENQNPIDKPADAPPPAETGVEVIEGDAAAALDGLGGLGALGGPPAPKPPVDAKTVDAATEAAKDAAKSVQADVKAAVGDAAQAAKDAAEKTVNQASAKFKALADKIKSNGPFMYLLTSVINPDAPTRRAGILFFVASLSAVYITFTAARLLMSPKSSLTKVPHDEVGDFLDRQAEFARRKLSTVDLGEFTFDVKNKPGETKPKGVFGLAVVTLMAECDAKETCKILEDQIPIVRNHVLNALSNIERDELLSRDGKKKVRKAVMDRLNTWLPKGKVDQIYVTKLVVARFLPANTRFVLARRSDAF